MIRNTIIQTLCGATLLLSGTVLAQNIPNPVKEAALSPNGIGLTEIPLGSVEFKTAAMAEVTAPGRNPLTNVARGSQQPAAVYAGLAKTSYVPSPAPLPAISSEPPASAFFDFKQSADASQVWATMNANGMPYVRATVFGLATAGGSASWKAKLTIPASPTTLYIQFVVPRVSLEGFTEQVAGGQWQTRFLSELLLDGTPVWTSEAIRGDLPNAPNTYPTELGNWTSTYGYTVNVNQGNSGKVVTLQLGSFTPGQVIELTLLSRVHASVLGKCVEAPDPAFNNMMKPFCTRATAALSWDTATTPVRFFVGN